MSTRVWVTRDEESDGPLCTALRAHGLTPVLEPVLTRRPVPGAVESFADLGPDDWLVLTSPYAIEVAAESPAARVPQVAVVGEPSRQKAELLGLRVGLVGEGDGDSLFATLRERAKSGKVCYARSEKAEPRDAWPGVELTCPILYETISREFDRTVVERIEFVAVASPSAVRAVGALNKPFASIGPTTSKALRKIGIEPAIEASTPSFDALSEAIAQA